VNNYYAKKYMLGVPLKLTDFVADQHSSRKRKKEGVGDQLFGLQT